MKKLSALGMSVAALAIISAYSLPGLAESEAPASSSSATTSTSSSTEAPSSAKKVEGYDDPAMTETDALEAMKGFDLVIKYYDAQKKLIGTETVEKSISELSKRYLIPVPEKYPEAVTGELYLVSRESSKEGTVYKICYGRYINPPGTVAGETAAELAAASDVGYICRGEGYEGSELYLQNMRFKKIKVDSSGSSTITDYDVPPVYGFDMSVNKVYTKPILGDITSEAIAEVLSKTTVDIYAVNSTGGKSTVAEGLKFNKSNTLAFSKEMEDEWHDCAISVVFNYDGKDKDAWKLVNAFGTNVTMQQMVYAEKDPDAAMSSWMERTGNSSGNTVHYTFNTDQTYSYSTSHNVTRHSVVSTAPYSSELYGKDYKVQKINIYASSGQVKGPDQLFVTVGIPPYDAYVTGDLTGAEPSVTGTVSGGNGELQGAEAVFTDKNGTETPAQIDGSELSADLPQGDYALTVSKDGYVPRDYEVTVGDEPLDLDLEIHKVGDIDGNGSIGAGDVAMVSANQKGTKMLFGYDEKVADVDRDGRLTNKDTADIIADVKGVKLIK